ncbi:MAG: pantetheine-phosphate adenylyltransferase [Calditrichia bacterium]|nr:pantetheine-phosphate adenylyltransferase [Calditrichia bacterium]
MKRAIYPGTFDPITYGHLDILNRAIKLFDEIIITIAVNPGKEPLFSLDERRKLIDKTLETHSNKTQIKIEGFDGLLVNFAMEKKASAIIRGLRAVSDFEYEFQMALMNRRLSDGISTVFMMPHEKYTYLNSTIVKEVARLGGNISNFVPPEVEQALLKKFSR